MAFACCVNGECAHEQHVRRTLTLPPNSHDHCLLSKSGNVVRVRILICATRQKPRRKRVYRTIAHALTLHGDETLPTCACVYTDMASPSHGTSAATHRRSPPSWPPNRSPARPVRVFALFRPISPRPINNWFSYRFSAYSVWSRAANARGVVIAIKHLRDRFDAFALRSDFAAFRLRCRLKSSLYRTIIGQCLLGRK